MFGLGQEKEWMRGGRRREGWRRMIWRWCEFDKAGQLRATPLTQTVSPCGLGGAERRGSERKGEWRGRRVISRFDAVRRFAIEMC